VSGCRKAVSAVFSVLLMVVIIFVAGILLYSFVSGMVENLTDSSSSQLFRMRVENVVINNTCLTIYVGNSFDDDVAVSKVYVNNESHDLLFSTDSGVIIPKSSSGPVYVMGSYVVGGMYDIKVIFTSGNSLITVVRY
jgi:flagellin-like protein